MRLLDIFSGIGGMSLGLERAGFRTIAFCELDPYCREVLAHHWPGVPIHDDVRTLRGADVGPVDLVAGGFPCQPVSLAGKRKGAEDARWLWPEMLRIVSELRPRWVLAENVPGLRTLGADRVLADLEAEGYACWPLVVGADDVGAPHRRKRVWIVARRMGDPGCRDDVRGEERPRAEQAGAVVPGAPSEIGRPAGSLRWPARPGEPQHAWEEPRLAYGSGARRNPRQPGSDREARDEARGQEPERLGGPGRPEQPLGCAVTGLPERLVRRANRAALRALGNAVVPAVVAQIGRAILAADRAMRSAS